MQGINSVNGSFLNNFQTSKPAINKSNSSGLSCKASNETLSPDLCYKKDLVSFKGEQDIIKFRSAVNYFGLNSPTDFSLKEAIYTEAKIADTKCKMINYLVSPVEESKKGSGHLAKIPLMLENNSDCLRVTTEDSAFGESMHTIGFFRNEDNLYVLDSLGDEDEEKKQYHDCIRDCLKVNAEKAGIKNIIFNKKTQQKEDLQTCNHWTFANLEAVENAAAQGIKINTPEELDEILPKSIISVLNKDYDYTKKLNVDY